MRATSPLLAIDLPAHIADSFLASTRLHNGRSTPDARIHWVTVSDESEPWVEWESLLSPRRSPQVLLVDEDPRASEEISITLMSQGFHVTWAQSSTEALNTIGEHDFDVALVEVALSDSTGVELVRLLNERSPSLLPILIASRPSLESAVAAVRVGAFDYLLKPIDDVRLAQVVREAVRAKAVIDAHGGELARHVEPGAASA